MDQISQSELACKLNQERELRPRWKPASDKPSILCKVRLLGRLYVVKTEDRGYQTPCYIWLGSKFATGYGAVGKGPQRAHRVSYEEYVGTIPPGLHILHRCDVPACIRPDHLFLGTNRDNQRDKSQKGRAVGGLKNPEIQKLGQVAAANARRAR